MLDYLHMGFIQQDDNNQDNQLDNLNYSGRRLKFFGLNDLATYYSIERAREVLELFSPDKTYSLNEIIELRESIKFIQNELFPDDFSEERKSGWTALLTDLKATVGRFFNQVNERNFPELIREFDPLYLDDLLDLLGHYGVYKRCSAETALGVLESEGYPLAIFLRNPALVKAFDEDLIQRIRTDPSGAELIARKHLEKDASNVIHLPKGLSIEQQKDIVRQHLEDADVNPNLLELISKAAAFKSNSLVDARLKLLANRAHTTWVQKFFDKRGGLRVGYETAIVEGQTAPLIVASQETEYKSFYSREWLEDTLDFPSILNNFTHLFEFADQSMRLNFPSFPAEMGTLEALMGFKGTHSYPQGIGFRTKRAIFLANTTIYERFLRSHAINLEEVIQWFYEQYLDEEFQATGFRFRPSSTTASFLERCRHLFAEMESVLKQFTLYVEEGEVDLELLSVTSDGVIYRQMPSLIEGKYIRIGPEPKMGKIISLMFSDQSPLLYLDGERHSRNAAELISRYSPVYDGLTEYQKSTTDFLVHCDVLEVSNGELTIKDPYQMRVLRDIFEKETASYHCYGPLGREAIDQMVENSWLQKYSSLLTHEEASYYNFLLNQAEYTDGPDLRNKYVHGSLDATAEDEHYSAYLIILKLLVGLAIKINDEFCLKARIASKTSREG